MPTLTAITTLGWLAAGYVAAVLVLLPFVRPTRTARRPSRFHPTAPIRPSGTKTNRYALAA